MKSLLNMCAIVAIRHDKELNQAIKRIEKEMLTIIKSKEKLSQ